MKSVKKLTTILSLFTLVVVSTLGYSANVEARSSRVRTARIRVKLSLCDNDALKYSLNFGELINGKKHRFCITAENLEDHPVAVQMHFVDANPDRYTPRFTVCEADYQERDGVSKHARFKGGKEIQFTLNPGETAVKEASIMKDASVNPGAGACLITLAGEQPENKKGMLNVKVRRANIIKAIVK